jgi:pimeloyl-ACP methyl ester carboxylesterase
MRFCVFLPLVLGVLNGCAAWRSHEGTVAQPELPGQRRMYDGICYYVLGEGPPLLLVHGFGATSFTWRRVWKPLSERFRVLAPDLAGMGCSAQPEDADYSLEGHLRRLDALLQHEGWRDVGVIGNSYGGTLALFLAARHPERVSRLVLVAPAAFVGRYPLLIRILRSPILGPLLRWFPSQWAARIALERAYADSSRITPEAIAGYTRLFQDPAARRALRATAQAMPEPDPERARKVLAGIAQPTLVLWGEKDAILSPAQAEPLLEALPHARLVRISDAGHALQEERPHAFLDAVVPFLMREGQE